MPPWQALLTEAEIMWLVDSLLKGVYNSESESGENNEP